MSSPWMASARDDRRGVDPEDEADVGGLAAGKWTPAAGNQARDVKILGVEKRYFDAAASHLVRGGFRARGTWGFAIHFGRF